MSKVSQNIVDGRMWINTEGKWCKKCPSCNREIVGKDGSVTTKFNVSHSIIVGQVCHSCIKIGKPTWASLHREEFGKMVTGKNHPMYGRHHTDEMKKKQAERNVGKKLSNETKRKLSESSIKAWKNPSVRQRMIHTSKWNNISVDKGQMPLIYKWNALGFKFIPNYQVKNNELLCYLDGYDKDRNVVLEYDSKYHFKEPQKTKDLVRQKRIIDILNPRKFWRYNSVTKTYTEIMQCNNENKRQAVAVEL